MKTLKFFIPLLFSFTFAGTAQGPIDQLMNLYETYAPEKLHLLKDQLDFNEGSLISEIHLDSTIRQNLIEAAITERRIFTADDQGRDTLIQTYNRTWDTGIPYLRAEDRISFTATTETVVTQLSTGPADPLLNNKRTISEYDNSGNLLEVRLELWNTDVNDFAPASKRVFLDGGSLIEFHQWINTEYSLSSKTEIIQLSGGGTITTSFNYDGTNYTPNTRITLDFDFTTGAFDKFKYEEYNTNTEEWFTSSETLVDIDTDNYTGIQISSSIFGPTGADFEIIDSSAIAYNSDWKVEKITLYDRQADGSYNLGNRIEYSYVQVEYLLQSKVFIPQGNDWLQTNQTDYYYNTTGTSTSEALPLPVTLTYQNPSTKNANILFNAEDLSTEYQFTLSDGAGRNLMNQELSAGTTVKLGALDLSPGIYFMSVRDEEKMGTWKLMIQ